MVTNSTSSHCFWFQFNTSVKEVTPKVCAVTNKPKWTVEVENEHGEKDVQEFDAVMVCTGLVSLHRATQTCCKVVFD